jgi:hypothetical protein
MRGDRGRHRGADQDHRQSGGGEAHALSSLAHLIPPVRTARRTVGKKSFSVNVWRKFHLAETVGAARFLVATEPEGHDLTKVFRRRSKGRTRGSLKRVEAMSPVRAACGKMSWCHMS